MKNFKLLFSFVLLLSIFGCEKEEKLIQQGLPETPIGIDKPQAGERQTYWDNFQIITPCEAGQLTYFIDPSCQGHAYESAFLDAIEAYNNAGSAIHFVAANSYEEADLVFNCVDGDTCGEAVASPPFPYNELPGDPDEQTTFPSGGTIGKLLNFEINWERCPCTGDIIFGNDCEYEEFEMSCVFQRTAMHEIAHALGIAHNGQGGSFGIPTHIPGTPDTIDDSGSVFNNGGVTFWNCDWCDAPCEFNENDITAILFLYPDDCPNEDGCDDEPTVSLECIDGLPCLLVNGQPAYEFASYQIFGPDLCLNPQYAGLTVSYQLVQWDNPECLWSYDLVVPDCTDVDDDPCGAAPNITLCCDAFGNACLCLDGVPMTHALPYGFRWNNVNHSSQCLPPGLISEDVSVTIFEWGADGCEWDLVLSLPSCYGSGSPR